MSTRLYPEWAVARLAHVSDDQAKKVAAALLVAPDNFFGNYNTHIYSFTVPLDYRSVDDLLRELKIDPYDKLRITSFREVLFFYRFEFSSGLLILIFSLISVFYYRSFAFRLRHAKERLLHELAERKKIEASLLNARKIADAASRAKSEFLANMSHEIRTPLNGVLGMLQLLETTDPNEEQKEYLLGAIRSTNRLTRLLSDILDISRIEAGRMEIVEAEFNIKETRDSIRELFEMEARGKGLLLEYGWNDNLPLVLIGDEPRLRQILFNLVGNALKFTEKGEVRIDASLLPGSSDSFVRVLFAVSDTGIGIADEYLKDIFEPFVQAEGSYTRRFQGAGLAAC